MHFFPTMDYVSVTTLGPRGFSSRAADHWYTSLHFLGPDRSRILPSYYLTYRPPTIAEIEGHPSSGLWYMLQPNQAGSPVFPITQVLPSYNQHLCFCVYTQCLNFALGVLSYVCKESSFASPPLRHILALRSPNSKSLNLQEKREPESKLIVNLCTLRSYEEYGKKSDNVHREKKTLLFTSIERSKYLFFLNNIHKNSNNY